MGTILFRGKASVTKEWVYGYLLKVTVGENDIDVIVPHGAIINDLLLKENIYQVDPETVGQYTGLKDNNGNRIFEGDIVDYEDEVPGQYEYHDSFFINRGVVGFCEGCFYFTNSVAANLQDIVYKGVLDCMVVGNIHDNPELLEAME